jgi:hypothetical protein
MIDGVYRDPEDEDPPRRRKAPKGLKYLKRQFTLERRLAAFREVFSREPSDDSELEAFAEEYIRELYNSGVTDL